MGFRALRVINEDWVKPGMGFGTHRHSGMGTEAHSGLNAVLVDHAKRPETHEGGIVVVGERKCVESVQPTVVGMAALAGTSHLDHWGLLLKKLFVITDEI